MSKNKTKKNIKGSGVGYSKPKQTEIVELKKTKKTRFEENPVSNVKSQSPRDEEDFYYSSQVNNDSKNIVTRKEKNDRKRIRQRSIVNYQRRQREQDVIDMALGRIPLKGGKGTRKKSNNRNNKTKKNNVKLDFKPNLTPREMFELGSFGGTYWRPIKSKFFKNELRNVHKKYPKSWWQGISDEDMSSKEYDVKKNKYGVKVGTSLKFWEGKNWIQKSHPYGWVHWYCDYCTGKRSEDDERQIKRWQALAGPRGRFMRFLVTQIVKKNGAWNDETISPKIRQVLQHWGYKLTKAHYDREIKRRNGN